MKTVHYASLDREYVLHFFGDREGEAGRAYLAYLEEETGRNREKELS